MKSVFGMSLCFGVALLGLASITLDIIFGQPGSPTGFLASLQQLNAAVDITIWLLLLGPLSIVLIVLRSTPNAPQRNHSPADKASPTKPQHRKKDVRSPQPGLEEETILLAKHFDQPEEIDDTRHRPNQRLDMALPGDAEEISRIDVITESRKLRSQGRTAQAIQLLTDSFFTQEGNYDAILMEALKIFRCEISTGFSSRRCNYLIEQREAFIRSVSMQKEKLSQNVWHYLHTEFPDLAENHMEEHGYDSEGTLDRSKTA